MRTLGFQKTYILRILKDILMVSRKKRVEYDSSVDSLHIHQNDQKILGSLVIDNFVIDISQSGDVIGLEIEDASKLFGMKQEMFENLKDAKMEVINKKNSLLIRFILKLENNTPVPGVCVIPRNKIKLTSD